MKKIFTLSAGLILLWIGKSYCQNIPTGATTVPGSITNVITRPSAYSLGSWPLLNYSVSFEPQYPLTNESSITETFSTSFMRMHKTYFDGFSRKMQSIDRAAYGGSDRVIPYDNRLSNNRFAFSPYSLGPIDVYSNLRTDPFNEQKTFYDSKYPSELGTAITESSYQSTTTSRTNTTYLPGKSNMGQFRGTMTTIGTNGADEVLKWEALPALTMLGYYSPGTLKKITTTNPDGMNNIKYYNRDNQLVSEWVVTSHDLKTYYVYDVYERLVYTLHPKAINNLAAHSWVPTTDILSNLCDYVVYDEFNRVVEKHQAGQNGNDEMVYDNHGRPVLLRKPNEESIWYWKHYDRLNRIIETGSVNCSYTRATMQGWFDNHTLPIGEDAASRIFHYLWNDEKQGVYPVTSLTSCDIHTYNFFDDYSHSGYFNGATIASFGFSYTPSIFTGHIVPGSSAIPPPSTASLKTKGKLTYSVSKVVKPYSISSIADFVSSANYYDDYGRCVQTASKNIHSDIDYFCNQFNFRGQRLKTINKYHNHTCLSAPYTTVFDRYSYVSNTGRLFEIRRSFNGGADEISLQAYNYNNLGQVSAKHIGGIETQELEYNIRGQLTAINKSFAELELDGAWPKSFGESIKYDVGFTNNRYSGDIGGVIWRSRGEHSQSYGYEYDNAGRLLKGDYREFRSPTASTCTGCPGLAPDWINTYTDYTEKDITYDDNGNINTLKRYGPVSSGSSVGPGMIDNLTYGYTTGDVSNRMQKVDDAVATTSTAFTDYDLKDLNTTSTDYSYDNNGNIIDDQNKKAATTYYWFNKPKTRTFSMPYSGSKDFVYTARGSKLAEIETTSSGTTTTEYNNEVVYKDNLLKMVYNSEGYSIPNATLPGGYDYYLFVRDHLGNVRNVLNAVPVETEEFTTYGGPVSMVFHAGHEPGDGPVENMIFDNIDYVRDDKPGTVDTSDLQGAHLDAADSARTIGTTLVLKVMAGDSFAVSAYSYYPSYEGETGIIDSTQFINSILNTLVHGTGASGSAEGSHLANLTKLFTPDNIGIFNSLGGSTIDSTRPLAFINYILYDENFHIVPENCGRVQIADGPDVWRPITSGGIRVGTSGYLAVAMTDLTPGLAVYIDPMDVYYYRGEMVDINHYYPYGLSFNKSTSSPLVENIHLYQTKKQDKTNKLYLDDFHARQYDPQLGRFQSLDPPNQFSSGYTGMGNRPSNGIDPTGMIFGTSMGFLGGLIQAMSRGGLEVWNASKKDGYVEQAWDRFNKSSENGYNLDMGMISTDPHLKPENQALQLWSRFNWEIPQQSTAYFTASALNSLGQVRSITYQDGATAVEMDIRESQYIGWKSANIGWNYNASALGSIVFGPKGMVADPYNPIFMHEYGHYEQSQLWGPLYISKIGFSSMSTNVAEHNTSGVEQDANIRALRHWKNWYPGYMDNINSDLSRYPYRANPWTDEKYGSYYINNYNYELPFNVADLFPGIIETDLFFSNF